MDSAEKSRRKFVKYLAYAGGTLFFSGLGAHFIYKDSDTVNMVITELKRRQKGKIIKDKILLEEYRTDFGKTIKKEPRVVVIPEDEEDVVNIFKIANQLQIPVSIRGAGHTCFGQSLSDGGILIVNISTANDVSLHNDRISVSTRTQWIKLEQNINRINLTSPVLPDFLELTVGGTLSVGGYGLRSFQHGAQVDNVDEMELILSDGEKVSCSAEKNSDLFRYSLCGLGQLGFINRVKFKPIRYNKYTIVFYILCREIDEFISTITSILSQEFIHEIDHFSSYWASGNFIIEIGRSFKDDKSNLDIKRLTKIVKKRYNFYKKSIIKDYHIYLHKIRKNWVEQYGISHKLWEDYIFDIEALKKFLVHTISDQKIQQYQNILPALYIVACGAKTNRIPFSPTQGIKEKMTYSVGFYFMVKFGDMENLNNAKRQLKENMEYCIEIGGRPYLYGWHDLSEIQKNRIYNDDYIKMKELKKKYDRHYLLNPGVLLTPI